MLFTLEKWLTKYARPFLRQSIVPNAPSPTELRDLLDVFLTKAAVQAPYFAKEIASLQVHLEAIKAAAQEQSDPEEQLPADDPTEGLMCTVS